MGFVGHPVNFEFMGFSFEFSGNLRTNNINLQATAQLHVTSGAAQAELARAFGISKISIKRAVKRVRPDDHYLCDGRDKLISCQYHPSVQFQDDRAGGYRVLWHRAGADPLFSAVAQLDITKDYNTAVALGPGGG